MATKKVKRALARARHEHFMEEYRRDGLAALRKDRERRKRKAYQEWEETHNKDHSKKKPIEECPWCRDIVKAELRRMNEAVDEIEEVEKNKAS